MNRSITSTALVLAGIITTSAVFAAEPSVSDSSNAMCREVSYNKYSRQSHGPAGKGFETVKVDKRTRIVCDDSSSMKKPERTAALMNHYKSA